MNQRGVDKPSPQQEQQPILTDRSLPPSALTASTPSFVWEQWKRSLLSPLRSHNIPRRLVFTYHHNILETKEPVLLYDNIRHTIRAYRMKHLQKNNIQSDNFEVIFYTKDDCLKILQETAPHLVYFFQHELHGKHQADICRVAALYRHGGYYLDVDMAVIEPYIATRDCRFLTAVDAGRDGYFQSLLASEPYHPILREALMHQILYYYLNVDGVRDMMERDNQNFGPMTLKWAHEAVVPPKLLSKMKAQDTFSSSFDSYLGVRLLQEDFLQDVAFRETFQRQNGTGCCCNVVVHDGEKPYFFSRVVGASPFCEANNATRGQNRDTDDAMLLENGEEGSDGTDRNDAVQSSAADEDDSAMMKRLVQLTNRWHSSNIMSSP